MDPDSSREPTHEVQQQAACDTRACTRQLSTDTLQEDDLTDGRRTRSPSFDHDKQDTEDEACTKSLSNFPDSFDYPESESARSKLISEALQKEDEFLEYLMSLPAVTSVSKDKTQQLDEKEPEKHQPSQALLVRSTSTYAKNNPSSSGAKVGLDHLDNLCKLMEQLGDLREQNSKLQRRVQYLEDLKNLQEMHKEMQQESKERQNNEETLPKSVQKDRHSSTSDKQTKRTSEDTKYSSAGIMKRELSDDCLSNNKSLRGSSSNKRSGKCKSATNSKIRQSLLRCQQRERSRSVGIEEIKGDTEFHSDRNDEEDSRVGKRRRHQSKHPQRRSVAGMTSANKAKVSKWTKVKEAFRWEKASVVILPEAKSQDSGLGGLSEDARFLRVPSVSADTSNASSSSPADSLLREFSLPGVGSMSSSSSSEDLDIQLNFSDIFAEIGPQRSASATDSTGGRLLVHDARRLSLSQMPEEEDASRRSKSLDGDATIGSVLISRHYSGKEDKCAPVGKPHKTPWSKVKDIIQTRKDSLKKRHRKGDRDVPAPNDKEDELGSVLRFSPPPSEPSDMETDAASKRPRIEVLGDSPGRECGKRQLCKTSAVSLGGGDCKAARRLTPMLTITLPSSEELRTLSAITPTAPSTKPPPSPQTEDRHHKISTASAPGGTSVKSVHTAADDSALSKSDSYRRQVSLPRPASNSAGTSPPVHRRASKWTKVKKAFLTSSPGRRDGEGAGRMSSSVPSSPNRNSSFLYEMDGDELDGTEHEDGETAPSIQAEIQRNYEELQHKLSLEFHRKLHEWERMKAASVAAPTSGAGGGGVLEEFPHHDKVFRRKMEEWERIKSSQHVQSGAKNRDSVNLQPLDEDSLSPDFRKKLQEWQRMKGSTPATQPEASVPPHFKKKIAEWQLWRTGSGKADDHEAHKRPSEWERLRTTSTSSTPDVTVETGDRTSPGAKTPSPGISRKDSTGTKGGGQGRKGQEPSRDKGDAGASHKAGGGAVKAHQKGKIQKEKELQWLEKELQKIEREKQRLEREREKYLEREARLEKMRRAMGPGPHKQEVLIQTSTGFFRFQGISEKFTKRLYEWEQARGIGPEASTFALLDPGYRPPPLGDLKGGLDVGDGTVLARSKSASSVSASGTSATLITHQPSSLSLNDVEALGQAEATPLEVDSRAVSEPRLHSSDGVDDEPAAVIVDIEDVVVETAAPLAASPVVQSQTPVYCYAPEEVTRLIDSSGSDSDRDCAALRSREESVRTERSYELLEENINLLSELRLQEDICRKLGNEIEDLEGKIDDVAKSHEEELERLRREETGSQAKIAERQDAQLIVRLRSRIRELERRQERLRKEGVTLQDSFVQHSEQQAVLAQSLVGNMKQLQARSEEQTMKGKEDSVAHVHELSTQLLALAEKLEVALAQRSREVHSLRFELRDRRPGRAWLCDEALSQSCGSLPSVVNMPSEGLASGSRFPRQSSEELSQLPTLLTNKVIELKRGLSFLCAATEDTGLPLTRKAARIQKDSVEDEPTATFILKVGDKGQWRGEENSGGNEKIEAPESPITSVTIVPAFWKRDAKGPKEETANRDSFCSAVSSASATSSVCDEDDEMEFAEEGLTEGKEEDDTDEEGNISDEDTKHTNTSQLTVGLDDARKEDEQTVKSEYDVDDSIEQTDHEESEDENNNCCVSETQISSTDKDVNGIVKEDTPDASIETNKRNNSEYYETEVSSTTKTSVAVGRVRKLLKTRRVSDTHVGYTCKDDTKTLFNLPSQGEVHDAEGNSDEDRQGETPSSSNIQHLSQSRFTENKRNSRVEIEATQTDTNGNEDNTCERGIKCRTKQLASQSNFGGLRKFSGTMEDGLDSPIESIKEIISQPLNEAPIEENTTNVNIPSNVFVKTTRKIFSPVRRDSKGKTSSVISFVVDELSGSYEREPSSESGQETSGVIRSKYSPVSASRWLQRGSNTELEDRATTPPAWVLRRSRSQSSSPAMSRRWDEVHANVSGIYTACPARSGSRAEQGSTRNENQNQSDALNESTDTSSTSQDESKGSASRSLFRQPFVKIRPDAQRDSSSEKSGSEKLDGLSPSSCPTTPSTGFPPLPQSPGLGRRDLKIASPSIRMMIAKYNQKLTEQDGAGGRSPEVGGSGSGSPVAWRSPVAERRVRAQMERYQEEVRRVLQQGGRKVASRIAEVQKSASAGVIRAPEPQTTQQVAIDKIQDENSLETAVNKPPSTIQRRGILKSSSAGSIKPTSSLPLQSKAPELGKMPEDSSKVSIVPPPDPFKDGSSNAERVPLAVNGTSTAKPPSPRLVVSPSPSNPSSPEIGIKHSSPPPSRLRALKLKRAKEEFLTRGPGGQSWTSEEGTPSASVSPEPLWTRDNAIGPRCKEDTARSGARSRLSQISVGSESSYDGSLMLVSKDMLRSEDERLLLVKSASAGMINVDPSTYRRFSAERPQGNSLPRSVDEASTVAPKTSKFGISSIASRFRKVKMRRSKDKDKEKEKEKEKDAGRMNTVSMLCRQSLLVDLHLSRGDAARQEGTTGATVQSTSSKSCPSSPVLQRSPTRSKAEESTASWIRNPARKIFRPK